MTRATFHTPTDTPTEFRDEVCDYRTPLFFICRSLYKYVPFLSPKWPICPEQKFFGTNHYYYFHLPIGPFHCAKFKKNSYSRSRVMRMHNFWAQNDPLPQMRFFSENLSMSLVYFIHVYLHAKNQSQILIY